jgi:hypothetical protein
MSQDPPRRTFLRVAGSAIPVLIAGCASDGDITPSPSESPTETPAPSSIPTGTATTEFQDGSAGPAPSCTGGYSSFTPRWVVEGSGPLGGFNITTDQRTIGHGDTLTVSLRNVTDSTQLTGNRRKYDVQYRGSNGWHTIFGKKDNSFWNDVGIEHEPNQGFTWQFPFSRDGLSNIAEYDGYGVCAPISTGTYRFVYWGITTEQEKKEDYETDYALGVSFMVTDN